jgi:hypothetical protein
MKVSLRFGAYVLMFGLVAASERGAAPSTATGLRNPPVQLAQWRPAYGCCTRYGRCPLPSPQPAGTQCTCVGPWGADPGYAC